MGLPSLFKEQQGRQCGGKSEQCWAQCKKMRPKAGQPQSVISPGKAPRRGWGSARRKFSWLLSGQREHHEQSLGAREELRKGLLPGEPSVRSQSDSRCEQTWEKLEWWGGACDGNQLQALFLRSFSESTQAGIATPALSFPLGPNRGPTPGTIWGKKKKVERK